MTVTFTTLGEQGETQARQWQAKVRQIMPAPEGSTQEETTVEMAAMRDRASWVSEALRPADTTDAWAEAPAPRRPGRGR